MVKMKPKECQNIEYKESWHDKYLAWICGFANAQGAVMYFGVNDDHEIVGLENVDRLMEDIPNKIVTTMGIVVDVNLHEQDGLEYIEVEIEPCNIPINYKGKYYYRSGSTMQELRGPALQQFILKKMGRSWDEITNEFATIDDLDRSAIDYFLRKGIKAGRISAEETDASTQSVLENLHLISEEGKLKNAALLLFAKNPMRYFTCVEFRIGRFRKDEADLITQDVVEGIHYEGMQRIETLEVPEDALREILYNSICHKDYTGVHIQMRVWDDYCEVWNEGELPMGYTPETLLAQHSSKPRNKNIAYAFFKAGFIESWGRGYKKIRDGFEGAGLPMPKIESVDGGVKVTFQRNNVSNSQKILNDPKDGPKDSPKEISERQMLMLKEMDANDTITIQEMTQKIQVSEKTIKREIALLQGMGALIREGGRKEGRWVVLIKL